MLPACTHMGVDVVHCAAVGDDEGEMLQPGRFLCSRARSSVAS